MAIPNCNMSHTEVGLAGEYYVLAQLAHRGFVGTLTLSHTKGVDILVANQAMNKLYKVEVKTTQKPPWNETLFGPTPQYMWPMSVKHETMYTPNLFYAFVHLGMAKERPRFFIVPSKAVAKYVRWQHRHWLSTRKNPVKETPMRKFRIPIDDPDGYEDNWGVFCQRERSRKMARKGK